jgi:hypothetical protein
MYKTSLTTKARREWACRAIWSAPDGAVLTLHPQKRTLDQNAKMWAMLTDIAIARPEGRVHTPDIWKAIFMNALGHKVRFEVGLDGEPFPVGFSTSKLSKHQMSDLIELIYWYAAQHNVRFSDDPEFQTAQDDSQAESGGERTSAAG